jgi:hypothetical protein
MVHYFKTGENFTLSNKVISIHGTCITLQVGCSPNNNPETANSFEHIQLASSLKIIVTVLFALISLVMVSYGITLQWMIVKMPYTYLHASVTFPIQPSIMKDFKVCHLSLYIRITINLHALDQSCHSRLHLQALITNRSFYQTHYSQKWDTPMNLMREIELLLSSMHCEAPFLCNMSGC